MESERQDRHIDTADGQSVLRTESISSEGTNVTASEAEHPVASKIRKKLLPRDVSTSEQFLPDSQSERMLSMDDINNVLKTTTAGNNHLIEDINVERDICPAGGDSKCVKILIVLILIEKPGHIVRFIANNVCDEDLPLTAGHGIFVDAKNPYFTDEFCRWQWVVLAPFIDFTAIEHHVFNPQARMPFLNEIKFSKTRQGAHGRISKISIHDDHHQRRRDSSDQDTYPYYAIKLFKPEGGDDNFENERDALARFSGPGRTHPNLIELFFSYEQGSEKYLIFPWAKYDLKQFWQTERRDIPSANNFIWLLQQCRGLAEGLCQVHIRDKKDINGKVDEETQGRHGDIKPQNILFLEGSRKAKGRFVLADFTLMRFHAPNALVTDANSVKGFSQTYRPPEVHGEDGIGATHKYDIWTLGCVYLEFVTWHLLGYDAVGEKSFLMRGGQYESFSTARQSDDDKRYTRLAEDKFFNFDDRGRATVKDSVTEWVAFLKNHQYASQGLRAFLDLVSKRMLVPNPDNRCNTAKLVKRLDTILSRCKGSAYYRPGHRSAEEIIPRTSFPRPFTEDSQYGRVNLTLLQDVNNTLDSQSESDMNVIEAEFLGSSGISNPNTLNGNGSQNHEDGENENPPTTGVMPPAQLSPSRQRISRPGKRSSVSLRTHLVQADSRLESLSGQESNLLMTPDSSMSAVPEASPLKEKWQRGAASEHEGDIQQGAVRQHNRRPWSKRNATADEGGRRSFSSGRRRLEAWKSKARDIWRRLRNRITT